MRSITKENSVTHVVSVNPPNSLLPGNKPHTKNPLDNIHTDLRGIIRASCIFNYSYFMLIINEYTRMTFISFLKTKTKEEVFEAINSFILRAERHWDKKVKMITTNGGGEFINYLLIPFCKSLGIVTNTTAPYTPQQNGLVECFMRTIATKA
jgi:transposase InsO family protein